MEFTTIVKKPYQKEKLVTGVAKAQYDFIVDIKTSKYNTISANDMLIEKDTMNVLGKVAKEK
ncbi:MAG: hypothetical protein LBV22_01670 [Mycoplasmataceae bacterium]|jgi:hypothetical protein|nr:hypothetical protein [Mycoplasmataceae bacterium]